MHIFAYLNIWEHASKEREEFCEYQGEKLVTADPQKQDKD